MNLYTVFFTDGSQMDVPSRFCSPDNMGMLTFYTSNVSEPDLIVDTNLVVSVSRQSVDTISFVESIENFLYSHPGEV